MFQSLDGGDPSAIARSIMDAAQKAGGNPRDVVPATPDRLSRIRLRRALSPEIVAIAMIVIVGIGGLVAVSGSPSDASGSSAAPPAASSGAVAPTPTPDGARRASCVPTLADRHVTADPQSDTDCGAVGVDAYMGRCRAKPDRGG